MQLLAIIILAALLVGLLIALSPFIFVCVVLYGLVEFIKYYLPSKADRKKVKEKKDPFVNVNNFTVDFLRKE